MKSYKTNKFKLFDKKLLKSIIIGVLCSFALITILTLICSLVITITGKYPNGVIEYISLAFIGIGGLLGGYISARLNKSAGLAVGALTGLIVFIIILIVGLSQSVGTITILTIYKLLVTVVFSALGGVLGVNKKNKIKI